MGQCKGKGPGWPSPVEGEGQAEVRETTAPRLRVLDDDGADRAVLRRIHDLLDGIPLRIDRLRLPLGIQHKDLRGDGLTHGVADAHVVIDPDAHRVCYRVPLVLCHRQRFERTEGDAGLVLQLLRCQFEGGEALGQGFDCFLTLQSG